jgi:UDP-hydrolysing UDP-N-acetyl-D-glucosamine 2-epimerase
LARCGARMHWMKKTICVALTNRTNYSKLKTVMLELRRHTELDCRLVLSSTILLERYGSSYQDLLRDGFEIDKAIDCVLMNDSHEAMAKTTGLSIVEHATYFAWRKPDLLLIVGDRFDMLAPVVAGATMNIPIAHIQGGELSGTIDNVIRDIITKFATLHFVATDLSATSLYKFGIEPGFVFNYGCPAVEYISKLPVAGAFDPRRLSKRFKREIDIRPGDKYFLVMVHPDTTNKHDVDMDAVMDTVAGFGVKAFVFYPNVDAHNSQIVSSIARYKNNPNFYMIRHMPLEDFVYTMAHCSCMISNSSSGIREAASFGVPVINLGYRQAGRERNGNVVDLGDRYDALESAIRQNMDRKLEPANIYYQPDCSKRIASEIAKFVEARG